MKIFDVVDGIKENLINRTSQYITGVAGCAKSMSVTYLRECGYKHAALLTPTQQLRQGHMKRFSNVVDDLKILTYSSVVESANHNSIEYDGEYKRINLFPEIFIFDEVFGTEPHLVARVKAHAENYGIPYIMLGDYWQSTRFVPVPPKKMLAGLEGYTLDESLRGDTKNRNMINGFYSAFTVGIEEIKATDLASLVRSMGGKVVFDLPCNPSAQYGYVCNKVARYIMDNVSFKDKIFTGKVKTKKDKEGNEVFSKKWENAPIVSQDIKEMIAKISGIKVPIATPKNCWTAITCIGCEVDADTQYILVFHASEKISLKDAYTLLSRQKTLNNLTVCILDDLVLGSTYYGDKNIIKVANPETLQEKAYPVVAPMRSVRCTGSDIGFDYNIEPKTRINVDNKFFKELLVKSGKMYTSETKVIYIENASIRPTGVYTDFKTWYKDYKKQAVLDFIAEFSPSLKETVAEEDAEKYPINHVPDILGELMQSIPGLVCDPTSMQLIHGTFLPHKGITDSIVDTDYGKIVDLSDVNAAPVTSTELNRTIYELDLKSSYWQMLAEYPQYIGYGEMIPYDKEAPISYYLCNHNGRKFILNSLLWAEYKKLGIEIDYVPLASRKEILGDKMNNSLKAHIHWSRQVRFAKESLVVFSIYNKPRFVFGKRFFGEDKKDCIIDYKQESSLYCMMQDILGIQYLIMTAIAMNSPVPCRIEVDAIKSDKPLDYKNLLPDWLPVPDYTITTKTMPATFSDYVFNADRRIITEEKDYAPRTIAGLRTKLAELKKDKKPSYSTKTIRAIEAKISQLGG